MNISIEVVYDVRSWVEINIESDYRDINDYDYLNVDE